MYIFNYLIYSILCLLFVFVSCENCMCGFESNSQRINVRCHAGCGCSEYQRYNFLKAIHNLPLRAYYLIWVVQNIKDTIF